MDKYYIKRGLAACVVLGILLYGLVKRDMENDKLVQRVGAAEQALAVHADALRQHAAVLGAIQPILAYTYADMKAKGLVELPPADPPAADEGLPVTTVPGEGIEVPIVPGAGMEVPDIDSESGEVVGTPVMAPEEAQATDD